MDGTFKTLSNILIRQLYTIHALASKGDFLLFMRKPLEIQISLKD